METLEHLSRRLRTFDDLREIVRTMKALAAVSIRQYEQAARSLAVYDRTVELGLHVLLRDVGAPPQPAHRPQEGVAAIVIGSDHGLCGRFNSDLVEYARERLAEAAGSDVPPSLLAVGERAATLLQAANFALAERMLAPGSVSGITDAVRRVLLRIEVWQAESPPRPVYIIHNRPVSGTRYHPIGVQLLPLNFHRFRRLEERPWPSRNLPMYTMDRGQLFSALLRQYFFVSIFRALAESLTAENASRLSAMQAAEKNLVDRHEELIVEFRRQRQNLITTELLDIVSGYETLSTGRAAFNIEPESRSGAV